MSEIDPEFADIATTVNELHHATGHDIWRWCSDGNFRTDELEAPIADRLVSEFEELDVHISRERIEGPTALVLNYDAAKAFIERDALERPHVEQQHDVLQEFLTKNYKDLVWYPRGEGHARGYVGYGYDLSQEEAIIDRFRKQGGVRVKPTDAKPNHDESTHGLFISEESARDLMQQQLGAQRG